MAVKRAHVIIQGQVQGVGYRYFAMKTAQQASIVGWVKNREDGSVELIAQGEESAIEQFAWTLRNKHPWAKINNMEIQWIENEDNLHAFEIKY